MLVDTVGEALKFTGLGVTDTESSPIKNIPFDEGNTDYQEYLEWAKTNTAEAAD